MISVTILTKNCPKYLHEALASLQEFEEVVIYDNGSTDNTLQIASEFPNVVIHKGTFDGFGPTHNKASALASHDWVLSIDSDEVVTPEMAKEIAELQLDSNCVYSFKRDNYYNGKHIKWCGWYPDRQLRLYNRTRTRFSDAQVHESIITDSLQVIPLNTSMKHYSYASTSEFLMKMQSYSDLFAQQNVGKRKASLFTAVSHALFTFFKSYVLKRGFLGGAEGFIISVYNANTAFYKYLKLSEESSCKSFLK